MLSPTRLCFLAALLLTVVRCEADAAADAEADAEADPGACCRKVSLQLGFCSAKCGLDCSKALVLFFSDFTDFSHYRGRGSIRETGDQ